MAQEARREYRNLHSDTGRYVPQGRPWRRYRDTVEPAGRVDSTDEEQSAVVVRAARKRRSGFTRWRRRCEQSKEYASGTGLPEFPARTAATGATSERLLSDSRVGIAGERQAGLARKTEHQRNEDRLGSHGPEAIGVDGLLVAEHQR